MGRPAQHDIDRLLDAAAELAAESGPSAVTVAAVARVAHAPSGSIYHRFPSRSAMLAALWLRTVDRFQEGFLATLETGPPEQAALDAARHVVSWSRAHPRETRILLYGPADFDRPNWPDEAREHLRQSNGRVASALRDLAARLGKREPHEVERLFLATVDLPYATVRRHHLSDEPIPAYAEDLVADCTAALIAEPSERY
ncbi:AcrR family transcriptional regulator [Streptosporangium album]|uniref:AcrR family transcriptional regulator n=1 Tax=Streptosporangium album TaxID=47479 RepID=A0A7W7W9F8_9ACTN|nr:TetR/AcrR family transcriptional regulator [Streptosporangium album]MBB4938851.1 AcrR family transcriptional regulator [Streptosporangium album]